MKWLNIKSMKLTDQDPHLVHIQYGFDGEYHRLNMSKRIRKVEAKGHFNDIQLNVLKNGKGPGIDIDKCNDLQSLCKSQVIPKTLHELFELVEN